MRVVASDTTVSWDGDDIFVKKGTLESIAPGSALEDAYGAANMPVATQVQADAAAGGIDNAAQSN